MKIAIVHLCGTIGKSTIAGQMLRPRIGVGHIYDVETQNTGASADGVKVIRISGREYSKMLDTLMREEKAVVDVGSSNFEVFLKEMQRHSGSEEEFDFYVVPVINDKRVIMETIKTIQTLAAIGVEKNKIRVIFNKIDLADGPNIEEIFAPLFGLAESEKNCVVNKNAVLYENDAYQALKQVAIAIDDLVADETNYREVLRDKKGDSDAEDKAIFRLKLKSTAKTANENMNRAFEALFQSA